MTTKAQVTEEKLGTLGLIKIKNFCAKDITTRVTKLTKWESILANYTQDKEYSEIQETPQVQGQKSKQIGMDKGLKKTFLQRPTSTSKDAQWHQSLVKCKSKLWDTTLHPLIFPGGSVVNYPLAMKETWVQTLGWKILRRRQWQSTPVFLPGDSHGRRNLAGYSPWGRKESTEPLTL